MTTSKNAFDSKDIQDVQDYWNARPCNIRHSVKPIGTREYFDEVEARKYRVEPHIPLFAEFDRWAGKKVLEIGCGIGTDTMNFARAGATVTAVDLSTESIAIARQRAEVFGLQDRITFYQANAEKLSETVPVEEYDLVYSFGVIHHSSNPENIVREIKKYMGPKSLFKIMVYNRHSWKVLWIMLKYGGCKFWKMDEYIARYSEAQTGCPVTYSYSRKSILSFLEGYNVTKVMVDHIFPYSIPEYNKYEYKKVWYFKWMPERLFRRLERLMGWHLCAEATLNSL